jgi:hypothetical protein
MILRVAASSRSALRHLDGLFDYRFDLGCRCLAAWA